MQRRLSSSYLIKKRELTGTEHWIAQRISAVMLIFLVGWFFYNNFQYRGYSYVAWRALLHSFRGSVFMALFVAASLYHAYLGLKIIVEDYVSNSFTRVSLIYGVKTLTFIAGTVAGSSLVKILFSPAIIEV